jgi:antitoxin component YwqK of YwqJK toxin-antitoxin module
LFINNEKQGHWIWYYDNGIKADEAWFENGNYIDSIYHWDSTGNIEHIEYLSRKCNDRELKSCNSCCCDGKNIWFDSSGNIYAEYYIVNGELDSTYTYFYPDGKVLEIYRYNKGKKNGVSEKYNKNGRLITKAKYRNNKLNGIYTEWDSLGNLIFNGEAINDSIYKK